MKKFFEKIRSYIPGQRLIYRPLPGGNGWEVYDRRYNSIRARFGIF